MDSLTPRSTLHVDLGIPFWDTPANVDLSTVALTIGGHYVDRRTGFGGYLELPLTFVSYDIPLLGDDSEFAVGNVGLGGMYAKSFGNTALVARFGLALPTADDDGPGAQQVLGSVARYSDLVARVPNSTWLRLGFSPMGRMGKLFWRADVGLDLALDEDNADTLSPIFRLDLGGGIDLGTAALMAELVTNITDSAGDDSQTTLGLGVRFNAGQLRPGVGIVLPIGWDAVYEWNLAIIASLAARM